MKRKEKRDRRKTGAGEAVSGRTVSVWHVADAGEDDIGTDRMSGIGNRGIFSGGYTEAAEESSRRSAETLDTSVLLRKKNQRQQQ